MSKAEAMILWSTRFQEEALDEQEAHEGWRLPFKVELACLDDDILSECDSRTYWVQEDDGTISDLVLDMSVGLTKPRYELYEKHTHHVFLVKGSTPLSVPDMNKLLRAGIVRKYVKIDPNETAVARIYREGEGSREAMSRISNTKPRMVEVEL